METGSLYKLTLNYLQVYCWSPRRTIQACNMYLCELNRVCCQSHPLPTSTPKASDQSVHTYHGVLCILPNFGLEILKTFHVKWKLGFFSSHFHFKIIGLSKNCSCARKQQNETEKVKYLQKKKRKRKSGVPAKVVFSR